MRHDYIVLKSINLFGARIGEGYTIPISDEQAEEINQQQPGSVARWDTDDADNEEEVSE